MITTTTKNTAYSDSITYRTPLTNTYNKLTRDKELTVVYFGGSLTNGYGCADIHTESWRAKSGAWLQTNFPDASIKLIDTAIGESGTHLGVYRVQRDVIGNKPDLLFVEYAINDLYDKAGQELAALRFETIVREVRCALPECDIVTVLTTNKNTAPITKSGGYFAEAAGHNSIATAYGLPVLNIGKGMLDSIAQIENNATWWDDLSIWNAYFIDGVHPNSTGHNQYFLVVKEFLENSLLHTDYTGYSTTPHDMPAVQNAYLFDGNRRSVAGIAMGDSYVAAQSRGVAMNATATFYSGTSQTPHTGYYLVEDGGYITFRFEGTDFSVWTNLYHPNTLTYSVDGGTEETIPFDGHAPTAVVTDLSSGTHTITLKANTEMKVGYLYSRDKTKQTRKGAR